MLFLSMSLFFLTEIGDDDRRDDDFSMVADTSVNLKLSGLGEGIWLRMREAKVSFEVLWMREGFVGWEEEAKVEKVLIGAMLSGKALFELTVVEGRSVAVGTRATLSGPSDGFGGEVKERFS